MSTGLELSDYTFNRALDQFLGVGWALVTRKIDSRLYLAKYYCAVGRHNPALLEKEQAMLRHFAGAGFLRPFELVRGRVPVLILEYSPYLPLQQSFGGAPFDVVGALELAASLTEAMLTLHRHGGVLGGLCPRRVWIDPRQRLLKITDLSPLFSRESVDFDSEDPVVLRDVLPYAAPELSGRTAGKLDQRSDLYSLGTILYELLTGAPPFLAERGAELLHAHVAREVAPISEKISGIPDVVSELVRRLLAKQPEQRYQSARGLLYDLERCRKMLIEGPLEPLTLGSRDRGGRLRACTTMYGRESQVAALSGHVRHAVSHGPALCVVRGSLGIGKSMFVERALAALGEIPTLWIHPAQRGDGEPVDLGRLLARQLCDHVMGAAQPEVDRVRNRFAHQVSSLVHADSGYGIDFAELLRAPRHPTPSSSATMRADLPIAQVVRPSPHDVALGAPNLVLARAFEIIAVRPIGLVVVIEDGQLVGDDGLDMLAHTLGHVAVAPLTFIWVERTVASAQRSSLNQLILAHRQRDRPVLEIDLGALPGHALERMLADMLERPNTDVSALAVSVARRSAGVPLVVAHFLALIEGLGLLRYEPESGWTWVSNEIDSVDVPQEAAAALSESMRLKSARIRRLLALASCLGATFELQELHEVAGGDRQSLRAEVRTLVEDGVLIDLGRTFRFSHPFLREAAQDLLTADSLREVHLQIARQRLQNIPESQRKARIFEVVEHLNPALGLLAAHEREVAVALNLEAGERALTQASRTSAAPYFEVAWSLLTARDWQERRDLAWQVGVQVLRSRIEKRQDQAGREVLAVLEDVAQPGSQRLEIARAQLRLAALTEQETTHLVSVHQVLHEFGFWLPRHALGRWKMMMWGRWVTWMMARRLADTRGRAAIEWRQAPGDTSALEFVAVVERAWRLTEPVSATFLMVQLIAYVLRKGLFPGGVAVLGLFALYGLRQQPAARWPARLLAQVERLERTRDLQRWEIPFVRCMLASTQSWRRSYEQCLRDLDDAQQMAAGVGDLATQSVAELMRVSYGLQFGEPLMRLDETLERYLQAQPIEQASPQVTALRQHAQLLQMLRASNRPLELDALRRSLLATLAVRGRPGERFFLSASLLSLARIALLLGESELALSLLSALTPFHHQLRATFFEVTYLSSLALARAELALQGPHAERKHMAKQLDQSIAQISEGRTRFGDGFEACYLVLVAARERLQGRSDSALRSLLMASEVATAHELLSEQILIERLRFGVLAELRLPSEAHRCADRLRAACRAWGADGLVAHFERLFSQSVIHQHTATQQSDARSLGRLRRKAGEAGIDVAAILRLVQAISSEIDPQRAVAQVLATGIEIAVAERGLLILAHEDQLVLEAEAHAGHSRDCVFWALDAEGCSEILPLALIRYVRRTGRFVHFTNSEPDRRFSTDPYFRGRIFASASAVPIARQGAVAGVLYLENALTPNTISAQQRVMLEIVGVQAAIALEHARASRQLRVNRDQLERKLRNQERSLHLAQAQAEQAERTRHRILLALEHDVRAALCSAVVMFERVVAVARKNVPNDHDVCEHAENARALGTIAAGALDTIAQRRPTHADEVMDFSLEAWIDEAMEVAARSGSASEGEWGVYFTNEAQVAVVIGDPRGAIQLLLEVIHALAARTRGSDAVLHVSSIAAAVELRVEDHGPHLSASEAQALLSQPVGRLVHLVSEGGVHAPSLHAAAKMAGQLGASLEVAPGAERGCVVKLKLPWSKVSVLRPIAPLFSGYRIGVVARSEVLSAHLERLLVQLGAQAQLAAPAAFAEESRKPFGEIDLLLVDRDALTANESAASQWLARATVPIIVLRRSHNDQELRTHEVWQRARPLVIKPVTRSNLTDALCGVLAPDGLRPSKRKSALLPIRVLVLALPQEREELAAMVAAQVEFARVETSVEVWREALKSTPWDLVIFNFAADRRAVAVWLEWLEQQGPLVGSAGCTAYGTVPTDVVLAHLRARGVTYVDATSLTPARLRALLVRELERTQHAAQAA